MDIDLNLVLWILQGVLALLFLMAGVTKLTRRDTPPKGMEWMLTLSAGQVRGIGGLEVLGAVGLIVPAATGILPILTPLAALGLAAIMAGAAVFHLRRSGEASNAVVNLVLGLLALFVAYGRFVLEPLS